MAKLFGCLINEAQLVSHALHPYRELLAVSEAESPFGWGLSHHLQQDVLSKRRPRHMGSLDFYKKVEGIQATAIVGSVRRLKMGRTIPENTQPFRFRTWSSAHSGFVSRFDKIRPWIINSIPDFLRRNIRGETDSEHLFHLFLAFLYDEGLLDVHDLPAELLAKAMRNTCRTVQRFLDDAGGGDPELNLLVTNGRVMVMAVDSTPVYYTQLSGLTDCAVCRRPSDTWNPEIKRRDHDNLKLALILTNPPDHADLRDLTRQEPKTLVAADQSFNVFTLPMVG
ncbi:MAG: class II glutamine amidotransferase [bacterium]